MKAARCLLLVGAVMLVGGCPEPTPGPEAVLSGEWETTLDDQTAVTFEFDDSGTLVKITGVGVNGGTAVFTVTGSTSTVDGSDVTVVWPNEGVTVTYEATLSEDENTLEGTVTNEIQFGDTLVVTIPAGDLTLRRPGTGPAGDATNGELLYTTNCAACHGVDAAGVVGPNIQNATAAEITAAMEVAPHDAAFSFTEQEILDLEAYLATF